MVTLSETWDTFLGVGVEFGHVMHGAFTECKHALDGRVLTQAQQLELLTHTLSDGVMVKRSERSS